MIIFLGDTEEDRTKILGFVPTYHELIVIAQYWVDELIHHKWVEFKNVPVNHNNPQKAAFFLDRLRYIEGFLGVNVMSELIADKYDGWYQVSYNDVDGMEQLEEFLDRETEPWNEARSEYYASHISEPSPEPYVHDIPILKLIAEKLELKYS